MAKARASEEVERGLKAAGKPSRAGGTEMKKTEKVPPMQVWERKILVESVVDSIFRLTVAEITMKFEIPSKLQLIHPYSLLFIHIWYR